MLVRPNIPWISGLVDDAGRPLASDRNGNRAAFTVQSCLKVVVPAVVATALFRV